MKKLIMILILIIALFISGCANDTPPLPESPPPREDTAIKDGEDDTSAEPIPQKNDAGIYDNPPADDKGSELDGYMASLEESSDAIQTLLETEALTQAEMNEKSAQLYELWDDALNYLWGELKAALPEEEFAKLLDEQLEWISYKENAAEKAGRDFEGGSMYPLIVSGEAARITRERVYEFYDILKQAD